MPICCLLYTSYLCAYVLNSLCFLLVGVPLLNLASSLLPLLLLSLLYRAPHWQRLWSALVIYAASFLLDTLVFLLMPAHTSQLGNLVSALLLFFMALVLEKRCPSSEKELQPDGPFYWFAVLLIPSTSIAMVILLFYFAHCPAWLSLLVDGMLILLNLLVFHLYRQVGRSYYAQYRLSLIHILYKSCVTESRSSSRSRRPMATTTRKFLPRSVPR